MKYMNCFEVTCRVDVDGEDRWFIRDKNLQRIYGRAHTQEDAESFCAALNRAYTDFINIQGNTVTF